MSQNNTLTHTQSRPQTRAFASFASNLILNTDSYKASHWLQYPPGTTGMFSYVESRGGKYERTVFFGLQMILKEYLSTPITHAMVDEAKAFFAAHGVPFNEAAWRYIVDTHGGFMPVTIRAVPEGTVLSTHHVMMTVECLDPQCFWIASYLETMLLRVWYPITVATVSWHAKKVIKRYLDDTSDDAAGQIPFKLHDFGARGVSSAESAAIGGAAHLVNFMGSDTVFGVLAANRYYHEPMAAYSIPAAEHSTITSWGKEGEVDAYRNMVKQFAKPGGLVAVVSDSYNLFAAITAWGTTLKKDVVNSGATIVVRPDSGDPTEVVCQAAHMLDSYFGSTVNTRGYKVLNHVRIIQGDGIDEKTIASILAGLKAYGFAADNVAFGMGGALLQQVNRDTQKFAMKCSAVLINGVWRDVFKDPATDPGKASKKGRLSLYQDADGRHATRRIDAALPGETEVLQTVWKNGELLVDDTLAAIRERALVA
jgi:nicotinamide phosphoribosyltransferase